MSDDWNVLENDELRRRFRALLEISTAMASTLTLLRFQYEFSKELACPLQLGDPEITSLVHMAQMNLDTWSTYLENYGSKK